MRKTALDAARRAKVDVLAPFMGAPVGGTQSPFTKIPDWLMLCERINATAFRLWCVLRSMQFENGPGIPPLTLDEICWLLPGVNGKPTSKARAREALESLLEEGVLKDVTEEGAPRTAPRLYVALDEPRKAMGFSGARRKLRRYSKFWRQGG